MADPSGADTSTEYVELVATGTIDFSVNHYSVVFLNNGSATADGWIAGGSLTYGFSITSGTVAAGDVVYVGGSSMAPTGTKLRVLSTSLDGDSFGSGNGSGVLGNGGGNADGIAVFAADIATLTSATVPVDAIFFGNSIGNAVVTGGTAGYQLPDNDQYSGGKLQTDSLYLGNPVSGQAHIATGTYNPDDDSFTTARTWTNNTAGTDSATAITFSGASTNPTATGSATPATVNRNDSTLLTVTVTPGTNPVSTDVTVTGDLTSIGGASEQPFFDDGTNGDATEGDGAFSYSATAASAGVKSLPVTLADAQDRTANTTIALTVIGERTAIHDIQGAAHTSPLSGQTLTNIRGIVTALRTNGFYVQERDADADANVATSEAIFVFTSAAPTVAVGDAVIVGGTVTEFRPGGASGTGNLTITEISSPGRFVIVQSGGNALPAATVLGTGGRIPPTTVIDDDATGDVETGGTFDDTTDGIDFYESLEAMRVQINDAVAVGPTNSFGETPVLADNGGNGAGTRSARGGIVIQADDFNPERIILDDAIIGYANVPKVSVGTTFPGATLGVLDYDFGNYKFLMTGGVPTPDTTNTVTREVTTLTTGTNQLTVATFNVENLRPADGADKFNALAGIIVNNLLAPDIIAIEEAQDNNGATNDATVDATTTFSTLIAAIQAANGNTGPTYQFRQIDPVDDADGGEPGGNIRVGFLFRTDRGVSFVDRAGATPTAAVSVVGGANGPQLSSSPGRIDPTNAAFTSSRKPLAGEFRFNGHTVFVIANHFNSKGGDAPLFGHLQPPTLVSEAQRTQQATIVRDFVDDLLAADADANVVVLGDLNDFQFSGPLGILKGTGATQLHVLLETLPVAEQYSYVYDGNSQALDHILVSPNLFAALSGYDVAHVNAEFSPQDSDHDPQLARFALAPQAPVAGSFSVTVIEDTPQVLTLQGTAGSGGALTYSIVSGPTHGTLGAVRGNQVTYTPNGNYTGPDYFTYKVIEHGTDSNTATVTITIGATNDSPVATDDSATTDEDTPKAITLPATDAEGDTLTYTIVSGPTHGTLGTIVGNQVTYTPNADYFGPDSFAFTANDGNFNSNIATITLGVTSVNDLPVASPGNASTDEDTSVAITLVASDVEGSPLTYRLVTPPTHGTLGTINGSKVLYTPAANYTGPDSFTFTANDGTSDSNVATVSITVLTPPVSGVAALTTATSGPGTVAPGSGNYAAGSTVNLIATANPGAVFIGWTVDGAFAGFLNPLPLTMNTDHQATATFATAPVFSDTANSPYQQAIATLAAYGAIFGYAADACQRAGLGSPCFGPTDRVSRAQMAALIARAMGWGAEDHGNPFTDRDGLDANLWRNVGTLAFYGVAYGYGGGKFGPNDEVTYLQSISFITRAMIAKGYWVKAQGDDPASYPNIPPTSPHRLDLVTFVRYTGTLPAFPNSAPEASLQQPATRGWYAAALLQALNSRFAPTP